MPTAAIYLPGELVSPWITNADEFASELSNWIESMRTASAPKFWYMSTYRSGDRTVLLEKSIVRHSILKESLAYIAEFTLADDDLTWDCRLWFLMNPPLDTVSLTLNVYRADSEPDYECKADPRPGGMPQTWMVASAERTAWENVFSPLEYQYSRGLNEYWNTLLRAREQ